MATLVSMVSRAAMVAIAVVSFPVSCLATFLSKGLFEIFQCHCVNLLVFSPSN